MPTSLKKTRRLLFLVLAIGLMLAPRVSQAQMSDQEISNLLVGSWRTETAPIGHFKSDGQFSIQNAGGSS